MVEGVVALNGPLLVFEERSVAVVAAQEKGREAEALSKTMVDWARGLRPIRGRRFERHRRHAWKIAATYGGNVFGRVGRQRGQQDTKVTNFEPVRFIPHAKS